MKTKEKKAAGGSRSNRWIFESVSDSFRRASLCSLVVFVLYAIDTCDADTLCANILTQHFTYIAFLSKNSGAVKHLHLPSARSLPLQAEWVFSRQGASYLWAIINIQDKQTSLALWMQCSLHKNHRPSVVLQPVFRRNSSTHVHLITRRTNDAEQRDRTAEP